MLVTELEASQMWCPLVRIGRKGDSNDAFAAFNTEPHSSNDSREGVSVSCIGSKCMLWRWSEPRRRGADHVATAARVGFCGASGIRPQVSN